TVRVSPACFTICNYGYIVTGSTYNGGPCPNECWQYNPNNDTWTKKAYFPGTPRVYATGFAIDTVGYVGFGADECSYFTNDFYAYHPITDTWTQIASCPGKIRDAAIGFGVNGKGYVGFGQNQCSNPINDWWE